MQKSSAPFAAILCAGLFAFAFVAAPKSCEWGLAAYFWTGVAAVVALLAAPFVLQSERPARVRVFLALGYGVLGSAVWFAGLFAANVRIMCRLF